MIAGKRTFARAGLIVTLALLGSACGEDQVTTPVASGSPTSPEKNQGLLVYVPPSDRDVWIYDFETGRKRRLTNDGDTRQEVDPKIVDAKTVSYVVGDGIEMIDLQSGERSVVVPVTTMSVQSASLGHDWTADGRRVAYLDHVGMGESDSLLLDLVIAERTGKQIMRTRLPIRVPEGLGGYCVLNETRVSVAGDGSLIGVELYAGVDDKRAVFLDGNGKIVGEPRDLRGIRFAPDGTVIADDGDGWVRLNPTSGESASLPVPAETISVGISPDGTRLAYDVVAGTGSDAMTATVHVADLASGKSQKVADAAAGPLWAADDALLVMTGPEARCWDGRRIPASMTLASQPQDLKIGAVESFDFGIV